LSRLKRQAVDFAIEAFLGSSFGDGFLIQSNIQIKKEVILIIKKLED